MYHLIKKIRSKILVYLTHYTALPILQLIRKPQKFPYSQLDLQRFPVGSLGKDLISMLEEKNFRLLPFYAKHDIKHLLLQYDTTDEGEICLQCFMLGNKHISFPVLATVMYGLITMPEHWKKFSEAYQRGLRCKPISCWQWFLLLDQPTHLLIEKVNEIEINYYEF